MKCLRFSATVTSIIGFFSVMALIFLYLALTDIWHQEQDVSLEWKVVQICILVLIVFTISTFITLALMIRSRFLFSDRDKRE